MTLQFSKSNSPLYSALSFDSDNDGKTTIAEAYSYFRIHSDQTPNSQDERQKIIEGFDVFFKESKDLKWILGQAFLENRGITREEFLTLKDQGRTDFSHFYFLETDLGHLHLKGFDFSSAYFLKSDLHGSYVCGSNFSDATFKDCNFQDADFSYGIFRGAKILACHWKGAYFKHVDFTVMDFSETSFKEEDFTEVDFTSTRLKGLDFRYSNLARANFLFADLTAANFQNAAIDGTNFNASILTDANFDYATYCHQSFRANFRNEIYIRWADGMGRCVGDYDTLQGFKK